LQQSASVKKNAVWEGDRNWRWPEMPIRKMGALISLMLKSPDYWHQLITRWFVRAKLSAAAVRELQHLFSLAARLPFWSFRGTWQRRDAPESIPQPMRWYAL